MGMIRSLLVSALVDRLLRGRGGHRSGYRPGGGYPGGGGYPDPYGTAPRYGPQYRPQPPMYPPRRRSAGIFPVPHYSTTTRRGSRVSVGGCCLPIPLTVLTTAGAAMLLRHERGGR